MESQQLKYLALLNEIGKGEYLSQRDLAGRMGMALGLVNTFLKRAVRKGYVKITTIPFKRAMYCLTPKGMAEKTRLALDYLRFSYQFIQDIRKNAQVEFASLRRDGCNEIAFLGGGEVGEIAYLALAEMKMNLVGVFSTNDADKFLGRNVLPINKINELKFDCLVVVHPGEDLNAVASVGYSGEIRNLVAIRGG